MSKINLMLGDCLERMKEIPDGSVDMVLTDPPYGTTACKWDSVIPFEPMWEQLKRVTKKNGAIVMTASQPFTSALVMSNAKMFRHAWVWKKSRATLFQHANRRPMKGYEEILCFGGCRTYNPQGLIEVNRENRRGSGGGTFGKNWKSSNLYASRYTNYPTGIIEIPNEGKTVHPTQKPVALMEYLIRTYTNPNETVLDFTMGSGTTGVAAKNLGRNFIGIEMDETYFDIAKGRIEFT
jgi:site-specific DNA-methyltransferase (adenine-specific)